MARKKEVIRPLAWAPQEGPQSKLMRCPCFEVFYGGARGGGKTDAMLGEWIAHAGAYHQDAVGIMVRRTRTELVETIERSKRIYGQLGATFNETEKHWRFPDGARLRFAYLERDADADAFQGHSYTRVYVEEAGTFPSDKPILKLMATLRSGAGAHVGIRLTGNPGGPGQQWVKNRYIDPCPAGYKVFTRSFENPFNGNILTKDWTFIPARVTDNAYLSQDYIAQLQMVGSKQLVQAWLTGDFSIVEGAFFDNWSEAKHVIPRFVIPPDWTRFRSMDWGSASPFSVGWWAVAGDDFLLANPNRVGSHTLPRGCLVRYREWYGAKGPNEGLKLTAEEVAQGIKDREQDETINYGVLDPSAFAESGGPSIAERMTRLGVYFRPADNRRVGVRGAMGGWDQMRNRLHGDGDDKPMLVVFDTCVDFIRTVPVLQHDPNRIEDVDTESEDHCGDECFRDSTLVDTDKGLIPISKLESNIHRIWSAGEWRSDYSVRMTNTTANIVRLSFNDGRVVYCTPTHKFLDCTGEWRYAKDLLNKEVSCDLSLSAVQPRNSTVSPITYAVGIFRNVVHAFTAEYGNTIMGPYHEGPTYIIRTTTRPITWSKILNVCRSRIISVADTAKRLAREVEEIFILLGNWLVNGMAPNVVGNGIRSITRSTLDQSWNRSLLLFVNSVGKTTRPKGFSLAKANSVILTVKPALCVSVDQMPNEPVFCLDVPYTNWFTIERGLIVSNCRYACMSRPYTKTIEVKTTKMPEDYVLANSKAKPYDWAAF